MTSVTLILAVRPTVYGSWTINGARQHRSAGRGPGCSLMSGRSVMILTMK